MQTPLLPYAPERDVYRLLQVEPSAQAYEIQAAIRRLARTFHPDRNASPRASEEMQVVYAVRNLLIDPHARARYDHARHRFLTETAARRRRAPAKRRRGVKLRAPTIKAEPIRARMALTGRALLAAFRAILEAFAPARGRLLTARQVGPETAARAAAAPQPAVTPASRSDAWEMDAEIVLDREPLIVEAVPAPAPAPAAVRPVAWEGDGAIVLEPVPMAVPPRRPLTVHPADDPPVDPIASVIRGRRRSVQRRRSMARGVLEPTFWDASTRVVTAAAADVGMQSCAGCGLMLAASARFCRRCGTSQAARSA